MERSAQRVDQRRRLLDAAVELIAEVGYPHARIGDLAHRAGVSRATFYELFRDKEDCFLAAHDELAEQLVALAQRRLAEDHAADRSSPVTRAIVDYSLLEPQAFSILTHEAALAGSVALERRERLVARIADLLERPARGARRSGDQLLVPGWVLLGGAMRMLGMRMRRGEPAERLASELAAWIECYRAGARDGARRLLAPGHGVDVTQRPSPGPAAPQPLPRGRHRLPRDVVRRVQRERILHATARVIRAKGYPGTTVADIVATAGVSREVFYSHFRSRSEAYLQTHRLVFEQLMATSAGAFFATAGPWPEQVWQSGQASTRFVLDAPSLAHFAFVDAYALGPEIAPRTDEAVLAFTVLLDNGYSARPEAASVPRSTSEAIIAATMEAVAFHLRHGRENELAELLPMMTYLVVTPFLGAKGAARFIRGKLRERTADTG